MTYPPDSLRSPSARALSRERLLGVGIVVVLVVCTAFAFVGLHRSEVTYLEAEFSRVTQNRVSALLDRIQRDQEDLGSIGALFESGGRNIEEAEFGAFAAQVFRDNPEVRASFWAPRKEGLRISYRHPNAGAFWPVGYDLGSDPEVKDLLGPALERGDFLLSTPFSSPGPGSERLVAVLRPLQSRDSAAPSGMVGMVIGADELLDRAFSTHSRYPIQFEIVDHTRPGQEVRVVLYNSPSCTDGEFPIAQSDSQVVSGRKWTMTCRASRSFVASRRQWGSQIALISGLMLAALLVSYLRVSARQLREMEQLVEARTALLARLEAALDDLKRAHEVASTNKRLRALGQMASGIAHDFNNALAPVLGFADLILADPRGLDDRERVKAQLLSIRTAASDAASVVRRLKEFYRLREDAEPLAPVDVNRVIDETLRLTSPRWRDQAQAAGIRMEVRRCLGDVPPIMASEAEVRQALTNLLFNAVDAMPRGGTITVSSARTEKEVVVAVKDTGTGMTEEVRRRCLEPFFTTKGQAGTGMGLSMVFGIVQRHEGLIDIESAPGVGTTVRMSFPFRSVREARPKTETRRTPRRAIRVLVVDDEPMIREVTRGFLELDGHEVETAANGREGIDRLQQKAFDLVITDAAMPEMSGEELASRVKESWPDLPVILLTGFGDTMTAAERRPSHVDLVLGKPTTVEGLRRALASLSSTQSADVSSGAHESKEGSTGGGGGR